MPVYADIENNNNALIRKGLRVSVFVAPYTAAVPARITDNSGDLIALPVGYRSLGWFSTDGLNWPRETETSDIAGAGSPQPLRSDIRRATKRLSLTALETNIVTIEQHQGVDLSTVLTALGGETVWDEPELPNYKYQRVLGIAKDIGDNGLEYYIATIYPRARATEVGESVWSDEDTPAQRPITYTAFLDAVLGTDARNYLGGPGRDPVAEGFPAPA